MIIKNALVLDETFNFINSDLEFDTVIRGITPTIDSDYTNSDGNYINADGCYVVPGFIDTHIHSSFGKSFAELTPEAYKTISAGLARRGTTSVCVTLSGSCPEVMRKRASFAAKMIRETNTDAKLLGIHFEGPFVASAPTGAAQKGLAQSPEISVFDEYFEASEGFLKLMTLAPEVDGAKELVQHATARGVAISAGHTVATIDEARAGFDAGITRVTHLFNAMTGLHHRNPGVVGAVFSHKAVEAELICDFFHVHPDVVKLTFDVLGADRITMITDAEVGAGMPDGRYFGSSERYLNVKDGRTYTDDGIICGGTSFMIDGIRNLVSIGISLEDAVKTATLNPARALGMADTLGSISVGKAADLIILDRDLQIRKIFVDGHEIIR